MGGLAVTTLSPTRGYLIPVTPAVPDCLLGSDYPVDRGVPSCICGFIGDFDETSWTSPMAPSLVTSVGQRKPRWEALMSMFDDRDGPVFVPRDTAASNLAEGASLRRVLAALSTGLANPTSGSLAELFERQLQQLLSMRDVRLREIPTRYQARLVTPTRTAHRSGGAHRRSAGAGCARGLVRPQPSSR
jgi:hypothetical protein